MAYRNLIALLVIILLSACFEESDPLNGTIFLETVASIEKMEVEQGSIAAEQLLKAVEEIGTPLFVDDTTAIIVVRHAGDSLLLMGDMNLWKAEPVFTRLAESELHYYSLTSETNARLQYWLQSEPDVWPSIDTLNPYRVSNGFGLMSELAMPGYKYSSIFAPFRDGHKSSSDGLDEHILPAGILPYEHLIHVWKPSGVEASEITGSIYFLDGLGYVAYAHMPTALASLINSDEIPPLMAVFVTPPNWEKSGTPNRETEYGISPEFVSFLAEELVPYIESRYPIGKGPETRLITGDSYGGLGAHYIGFNRPDVFGLAYSQSGYMSFKNDSLIGLYRESEKLELKLALDCGTYETQVGGGMLPTAENDFLAANRRMAATLVEKGYEINYREYPEGHTWGNWRQHLVDVLPWFFGTGKPVTLANEK